MASPTEPAAKLEFFNKTNEQMDAAIRPRRPLSLAAASQAEVGNQALQASKALQVALDSRGGLFSLCEVPATPAGSPAKGMSLRWGFS